MELKEKLKILSDAAKYDAACTSSGVDRKSEPGALGNSSSAGVCHSFSSDGRCISLLKILLTNHCIYDCKYCINRRSNDIPRAAFTPDEVCTLTIEFYRRNYIEGLFLSSGVIKSPDYTMEQIYEAVYRLRNEYRFRGYIHIKAIPGTDPALIKASGRLVDRMSVNLELPTADGLKKLAPHKSRQSILTPMRSIQKGIVEDRLSSGKSARLERARGVKQFDHGIFNDAAAGIDGGIYSSIAENVGAADVGDSGKLREVPGEKKLPAGDTAWKENSFVPAGQSTQIIVGATPESDYQMLMVTQALYRQYDLKRVFFSAYIGLNDDSALPEPGSPPPLLREHRLYQGDWLIRNYGFRAEELLSEDKPNFNIYLDPKCDWALRHLEYFPVEVMTAGYETLMRVPGIGAKSARRIAAARRHGLLSFNDLKKMGVVLKRAHYFITCGGKQMFSVRLDEDEITAGLMSDSRKKNWLLEHGETYRQLSLFDDMSMEFPPEIETLAKTAVGRS